MKMKRLLTLLLCLVLALATLAGCAGEEEPAGDLSAFTAATLDGESFCQDGIKDKDVTVINVWGMFCGPCRAEMPELAAYAKALPDNVQLITACVDAGSDPEGTRDFLASCGYDGVTLVGGDENFLAVFGAIQSFPTTIFVNGRGEIVGDAIVGRQPDLAASFTSAVNKVLKNEGKAEIAVEVK